MLNKVIINTMNDILMYLYRNQFIHRYEKIITKHVHWSSDSFML